MSPRRVLFLSMFTISLSFTQVIPAPAAETQSKVRWKITGDLEEACLCSAPCPCWFNSLPTRMHCGGTQILFIKKGSYGNVRLDGLSFGHFGRSPDGKTMMESYGDWDFSYLYIDERANEAQRKALEAIAQFAMPVASSANQKVQFVPIQRAGAKGTHTVTIGNVATFDGSLLEGGLGGFAKITNPPGADPIHHEYLQGRTGKLVYTDAGQNWNAEQSNYMRGEFSVTSEQYEKYVAGLAQKTAEMQKSK